MKIKVIHSLIYSLFSQTNHMLVSRIHYLDNLAKYTALKNWIVLKNSLEGSGLSDQETSFLSFCGEHINESRSQILQDLFVLWVTNLQEKGICVEFGAADGITHSNSYLLEKNFNWDCILIEPLPSAYTLLKKNRKNSQCIQAAVDPMFSEKPGCAKLRAADQLSALDDFLAEDSHSERRLLANSINVKLINLNELLAKSEFSQLDCMSIDTEGSEAEIVCKFDWQKFSPKVVTIETNGRETSETLILSEMKKAGYTLFSRRLSRWDMWFIRD